MLTGNIFFIMSFFFFKSSILNISASFEDETYTLVITLLMQFYIFFLNTWSFFEITSHLIYWCKGYHIGFYSREEQIEMLGSVAKNYNAEKFTEHKSCVICFEAFVDKKSKVTMLPCDSRHYFHTECIQNWTERHNSCPLCKKEFNV